MSKVKTDGYSLLETLIAVSILLIIAGPILSGIYRNNHAIDAEHIITAIGLLEQEACRLSLSADAFSPVKKRMVNGREWTVNCSRKGAQILQYHLEAVLDKKKINEIYFLSNGK